MKYFNKKECFTILVMSIPIMIFALYVNLTHPLAPVIGTYDEVESANKIIRTTENLKCEIKTTNKKTANTNKRNKTKSIKSIECTTKTLEPLISNEVELLARVIYAEAGNQDRVGKILVADVVLNRCDNDGFPDNIVEVISQKHQFETYSTGAIWKYNLDDSCIDVALQEMEAIKRYNEDVLYFRTDEFHTYGTPLFQHQDHYFNGQ